MILCKTPLRMSFVGGGSDIPTFYRDEIGAVLSTTIDKHIYIAVNKKFDGRIRINYSRTEEADNLSQVEHPLVRHAMDVVGIDGGIEIASTADIPSRGSGLGSSSAYTVGLLNALNAYRHNYVSKDWLAEKACEIEIDRCGEPIGKQDQYAAAFGGLNLIQFYPDERVSVDPVICDPSVNRKIEENTLVFFTGRTRSASAVLAQQSKSMLESEKKSLMRRMVELAYELKKEIETGSIENFGHILDENWRLKTQLANGISDPQIDGWYTRGVKAGALGGKLLGAGNGGFMMFYAPVERHAEIIEALPDLQPVKFRLYSFGSQVVFYQSVE